MTQERRADGDGGFRFSIVIPSYQRRDLVLGSVDVLCRQDFPEPYEVIVAVDGSTDGTAAALRKLDPPFPLVVLEQANRGAAVARNRGASVARGEILLFLDDDMESAPNLLAEHDRSHRNGADAVLGHMPLHPQSPHNLLSVAVKRWSEGRIARLAAPQAQLTLHDLLTGQMSVRRSVFWNIGGFDPSFTRNGSFGNEDIDFGHRLLRAGYRVLFNPRAISWQRYVVGPAQHLKQWHDVGTADVAFARRHADHATMLFALNAAERGINRWLWRPLACGGGLSALLLAPMRWLAITLVERGAQDRFAARLFYEVRCAEYWRGVHEAGGIPGNHAVRVLAYHAIADLAAAPVLEPYGVSPRTFAHQIDLLQKFGFHVVSPDEFLRFLTHGGGLPRRPVLLTFDDCHKSILKSALPVLEQRGLPALAFAVSGRPGGTNFWDQAVGAAQLRRLDAKDLSELARHGVEIGAHSRTHRPLTGLSDAELLAEIQGSVADLEAIGLRRPRFFAYPYGECDQRVEQTAEKARLQAAFTVSPGRVRTGDPIYRLPRIEILRNDIGLSFLLKVFLARRLLGGVWREWRVALGRLRRRLRRMGVRWPSLPSLAIRAGRASVRLRPRCGLKELVRWDSDHAG